MVGDARVVAIGEATHGTHEFFSLRHRLIEYLVAEHGFTVIALEADGTACRAIDDYVVHGTGDARDAIARLGFWTLDTVEMLAFVEWLRAWNLTHATKVHVVGFDAHTGGRRPSEMSTTELFEHLEARDRAMADRILALLEHAPPEAHVAVWAHNAHVTFERNGVRRMGEHLRERLGDDYLTVGAFFGHGSFRAVAADSHAAGPVVVSVGRPARDDVTIPFARLGGAAVIVDVREVPAEGAVHDWLAAPHARREVGAIYDGSFRALPIVLPEAYDVVVYVDPMTSSRPLPR